MNDRLCPECGSTLAARASYCGCGWGKKKKSEKPEEPPRCACAYDTCARLAVAKIKTATGWANLCAECYSNHFFTQAEKHCIGMGLDTVAKRRQWVKENMPVIRRIPVSREPGEDEDYEYRAA